MTQETRGWMACYNLASGQNACYGALFASNEYAAMRISATVAISAAEHDKLVSGELLVFERPRKHRHWGELVVSCQVRQVIDERKE